MGVGVHLDGRLEFQLVQDGELATLLAQLDEVAQLDGLVWYRLRQRVVLVACFQFDFLCTRVRLIGFVPLVWKSEKIRLSAHVCVGVSTVSMELFVFVGCFSYY